MTENVAARRDPPRVGTPGPLDANGRPTVDILFNPQALSVGEQAARDAVIHMLFALRRMGPQARTDALVVLSQFASLPPRFQQLVLEAVTAMEPAPPIPG
jgi:hypothetical protein